MADVCRRTENKAFKFSIDAQCDRDDRHHSPLFEALGHSWRLAIYPQGYKTGEAEKRVLSLGAVLEACTETGEVVSSMEARSGVQFSLRVINLLNPLKTAKSTMSELASPTTGKRLALAGFISIDQLRQPSSGFVDGDGHFHVLADISCPQPKTRPVSFALPPPDADRGNTLIMLDNGDTLRAHSFWLEAASDVFRAALACRPKAEQSDPANSGLGSDPASDTNLLHLPLPGVSKHQVLLLLHCLYAWASKDWTASLTPSDLLELARIADKYACARVLKLVDSTLVAQCRATPSAPADASLSVSNAPAQLQFALDLNLPQYEAEVAQFLGMHASQVDLSKLDKTLANVLRGASKSHAALLSSLLLRQA